jgi:hypothetical protein
MSQDKHALLNAAMNLRGTITTIGNLLEGYEGIEGNKRYVAYCKVQIAGADIDEKKLLELYELTYNEDIQKRKEIDLDDLIRVIINLFDLLDKIDTAGDIFKPKWCKFTSAVEQMHRLRWLVASVENDKVVISNMKLC